MYPYAIRQVIFGSVLLTFAAAHAQSPIAPTPPMGWNSYDCFGYGVTEAQVLENADYMAKNLKRYGWEYVVVDYVWSCPAMGGNFGLNQDKDLKPRLNMDQYGRLLPDPGRFPSSAGGRGFGPLAEAMHNRGLKFGIHLMRGIPRQAVAEKSPVLGTSYNASDAYTDKQPCTWLNHMWGLDMTKPAAQGYLDSLFQLYAQWGVDFVKVDDLSSPYSTSEVEGYRDAIKRCRRQILLSLSPGPTPLTSASHVVQTANMWRLLGDLWDTWDQLSGAFRPIADWEPYKGMGHWPDPDMLPLGKLRKYGPETGPPNTDSRLTKDEARTLMTLWCIGRCPLMFGGNLPETDPYTLSLITNPEVIRVNQQCSNSQSLSSGLKPMWIADSKEARLRFLAVFNRSEAPVTVPVRLSDLGIKTCKARDLWLRKDIGEVTDTLNCAVPPHGSMLYQLYIQTDTPQTEPVLPTINLTGDSYEAESPDNTLSGGTRVDVDVAGGKCSGGKLVRFIGSKPENKLQFNKVMADKDGDFTVMIVYMCATQRSMFVGVNGGETKKYVFPATGGWNGKYLEALEITVHLKQGANTIEFGNPTDWGVDVDRIVVRVAS